MRTLLTVFFFLSMILSAGPIHAETIELVTYYPAVANMGDANLNAASVGTLGDEPGPGELFVENRVRVGEPGLYDPTDAKVSMFSPVTNIGASFIHMHVTDPIPTSQTNQDLRALTISKRNAPDNARLDWTLAMGEGDTPGLFFFRALRPDSGAKDFETPLYMDWDNQVGIGGNTSPEAMLHIGNANKKGDILLENPRGIQVKDKDGVPQYILTYTTANNTHLQQNAATGGMLFSVNNSHQTGDIYFRTGLDNPNTPEDEALRMSIEDTGTVVIKGNLVVDGEILSGTGDVDLGNGDTSGDGRITPIDPLMVINFVNKRDPPLTEDEIRRADMNGDGYISAVDAQFIVDKLNANGNGSPAGPITRGHVSNKYVHENTLVINSNRSVGVGTNPVDFASPANNSKNENLSANDIYLKATGQWLSSLSSGNTKIHFGSYLGNSSGGGSQNIIIPELNGATPRCVLVFSSTTVGSAIMLSSDWGAGAEPVIFGMYSWGQGGWQNGSLRLISGGFRVSRGPGTHGLEMNMLNNWYSYIVFYS